MHHDGVVNRDDWDRRYSTDELIWRAEPNRFAVEHLAQLDPGRAIDLAGGEGRNAVWLAELGWEVTVVDFSAVGLEKATKLAQRQGVAIETVTADALVWTPSEPVDLVVIAYLQLPTDAQASAIERTIAWLRPGGTIFIVAHDHSNVADGYGGPPVEEVCYDLDRTVAALAGTEIVHAAVEQRTVDTNDGPRTALDTVVVARTPSA